MTPLSTRLPCWSSPESDKKAFWEGGLPQGRPQRPRGGEGAALPPPPLPGAFGLQRRERGCKSLRRGRFLGQEALQGPLAASCCRRKKQEGASLKEAPS